MIYTPLFEKFAPGQVVQAAVIGTGHFATAIVTQSQSMPRLHIAAVADLNIEAAKLAFRRAGLGEEAIAVCESRAAALRALELGQRIVVQDCALLMDLPLGVIVEATGAPEAGARHALAAIRAGKHVVMANKETDCAVGPLLNRLARQAGVVYTQADGDQHGLLISLVNWARELGLEVLCAGKARDGDFVHDVAAGTVSCGERTVQLSADDARWMAPIPTGAESEAVEARRRILQELPQIAGYDVAELAVAANATGLRVEVDELLCPALHTAEIPRVLCPRGEGGILSGVGVIDAVTSLHYLEEAHLGGGVFMVVSCATAYSREILATKGCLSNGSGNVSLIYRPYHLCGVETPMSILCAGLLGVSTGATADYGPSYDIVVRARRDLRAGEVFGNDHSPDLQALLRPASPLGAGNALPSHLGVGNRLAVDIPRGTVLTSDMVQPPTDSVLWQLRREQDGVFALAV